jgi:hypothetical protein
MRTIGEIIAKVDKNNPNAFSRETKLSWIAQLDGKIAVNVLLLDVVETEQLRYSLPDAMDYHPLLKFPHDDIYELWLNSRIHAENGETDRYANTLQLYNAMYKDFARWFLTTYAPAQGSTTYYSSAYDLAVERGYSGSLDEWLQSLIGPKGNPGKSAYQYAVEGGYDGSEEAYKRFDRDVVSDPTLRIPGGFADAAIFGERITDLETDLTYLQRDIDSETESVPDLQSAAEAAKGNAEKTFPRTGGKIAGDIDMDGHVVTGLPRPEAETDAVPLGYLKSRRFLRKAVLDADGWKGENAPFIQTVTVTDLTEGAKYRYWPVFPDIPRADLALETAWKSIVYVTQRDDELTFVCLKRKPGIEIEIEVEVHL